MILKTNGWERDEKIARLVRVKNWRKVVPGDRDTPSVVDLIKAIARVSIYQAGCIRTVAVC